MARPNSTVVDEKGFALRRHSSSYTLPPESTSSVIRQPPNRERIRPNHFKKHLPKAAVSHQPT